MDSERDEEIMRGPQIPQIALFVGQHRPDWKEHVDNVSTNRIPEQIVNRKEKKFCRTCEKVEGLCSLVCMMFVYVPNTRKVDDDKDRSYSCVNETRRATPRK
jgi:hypothetical protein